jgi:hypothetical protein
MLEPWASENQQINMLLACKKHKRKDRCNDCDNCPLNIKFLHTPQTEPREIVYTAARILADDARASRSLAITNVLFVLVVLAIVFLVGGWRCVAYFLS